MIIKPLLKVISLVVVVCGISDLDLSDFSRSKGFEIKGSDSDDKTGSSVSRAGDVNNDGFPDVIIKARAAYGGLGVSYVLFGNSSSHNFVDIDLNTMVTGPATGFRILGAGGEAMGRTVSAAGDVNNDGIDDFMIGAPLSSLAYVIYGNSSNVVRDIDLVSFVTSPETGYKFIGISGYKVGWCVSTAGDINGDHVQDLIVTARDALNLKGITYIIFGNYSHNGDIYLNTITDIGFGFRVVGGNDNDGSGFSASGAGDVNGDGIGDIIIGAPFVDTGSGAFGITYVIYGRNTSVNGVAQYTDVDLSLFTSTANTGYRILGGNGGTINCGWDVSGVGDINDDGFDDILTTSYFIDTSHVFFGRSSVGFTYQDINLDQWNPTFMHLGFRLSGVAQAASSAGDLNGDGYDDIVCSYTFDGPGKILVVYGHSSLIPFNEVSVNSIVASETIGFVIFGASGGDEFGISLSSAGDYNGDGYNDIIVGAQSAYGSKGAVYVIYGEPSAPTSLPSTQPSSQPSALPSGQPTSLPTMQPTSQPSAYPSSQPTVEPSSQPSDQPSQSPTNQPSGQPTRLPSAQPSSLPSQQPSAQPSYQPSVQPSVQPSSRPSSQPSSVPTRQPSAQPSAQPISQPSSVPSKQPSAQPTTQPAAQPSSQPSTQPSRQPTSTPSQQPTAQPSCQPTLQPSGVPSRQPSAQPSSRPSRQPSTAPSGQPSMQPSAVPSVQPSRQPSSLPSAQPSARPTAQPTQQPSSQPSVQPSAFPTCMLSMQPTGQPSNQPTEQPSIQPSGHPSVQPTANPSSQPSVIPSATPSGQPSAQPSMQPTSTPTSFPSSQPSRQPSSQPTMQPSRQPSTQPSSQPSMQPTRQPTGQPTHVPTVIQITTTGEWSYALSANITSPDVVSVVGANIWKCGGTLSITCLVVDANTGLLLTKYTLPWDKAVSVLSTEQANSVIVSASSERSGVTYSEVAVCEYDTASLLCSVLELSDTTFTTAVTVPYTQQKVYMGQYNALPSLTIVDPSTSGGTGAVRSYVYTPSAVRSMQLTRITSVPSFAGAFLAGLGTATDSGETVPVIVAGWVNSNSGVLSAMYLTPSTGNIVSETDLVNVIAMAGAGPDSFIAGGLQVGSGVKTAYLVRMNALYQTASFGVKYVSKSSAPTTSAVKGMVSEGSSVYLLLDTTSTIRTSANTNSVVNGMFARGNGLYTLLDNAVSTSRIVVALLKVNGATGAILQQQSLSVPTANVSCNAITANALSLVLACTVVDDMESTHSAVVLATNRDLSFKRLPNGWMRNSTISFTTLSSPFEATPFAAPTASRVIPTSNFAYSTSGQAPSWRPTVAPTIKPSARPSMRPSMQPSSVPSGKPSSSPTAAPSISPRPTSQPSTGGPTNTNKPSVKPTLQPSPSPTLPPTVRPSARPTVTPTTDPTMQPSADPSMEPSIVPSVSPTETPTLRPTRTPTARPSRRTSATPTIEGSLNDDIQPVEDAQNKQGNMTQELIIGVSAAGGVLAFGIIAISLCALCSYKLRKNREKYLQSRKTILPLQRRSPPVQTFKTVVGSELSNEVTQSTTTSDSQGIDKEVLQHPQTETLQQTSQSSLAVVSTSAVHMASPLVQSYSYAHSDAYVSDGSSSIELSSLHSSEMSDFEYEQKRSASSPPTSVRRLSEMEAQRTEHNALPVLDANKGVLNRLFTNELVDSDDDSSIERGFNEIMAEFSDDSSWDSSA